MKRFIALGAAVCLLFPAAALQSQTQSPPQTQQLLQGTQLRLVLLNGLSTSVAREGDPFTAVVAEPVYLGGQLILPAGVRVIGEVGNIVRGKRLSLFRGEAAMNLRFKSIEIERREVPVQMSILSIHETSSQNSGRKRKDLRVEEGVVVEQKHDIKGDAATVGMAGAGGTVVGVVFSHVVRGLGIGLIGGTAYVMVKKGKEVELPAQTGFLVRMDGTVTLPTSTASAAGYTSGNP